MSLIKTKAALMGPVKTLAGSTYQLEPDNTTIAPLPGKVWLQARFSPNPPRAITCGDEGEDELTGFLQVNVNAPAGKGENAHNPILLSLYNAFKIGTKLTYDGQEVTVTQAGAASGFPADSWYRIPFTIAFYARYPRSTPV